MLQVTPTIPHGCLSSVTLGCSNGLWEGVSFWIPLPIPVFPCKLEAIIIVSPAAQPKDGTPVTLGGSSPAPSRGCVLSSPKKEGDPGSPSLPPCCCLVSGVALPGIWMSL